MRVVLCPSCSTRVAVSDSWSCPACGKSVPTETPEVVDQPQQSIPFTFEEEPADFITNVVASILTATLVIGLVIVPYAVEMTDLRIHSLVPLLIASGVVFILPRPKNAWLYVFSSGLLGVSLCPQLVVILDGERTIEYLPAMMVSGLFFAFFCAALLVGFFAYGLQGSSQVGPSLVVAGVAVGIFIDGKATTAFKFLAEGGWYFVVLFHICGLSPLLLSGLVRMVKKFRSW